MRAIVLSAAIASVLMQNGSMVSAMRLDLKEDFDSSMKMSSNATVQCDCEGGYCSTVAEFPNRWEFQGGSSYRYGVPGTCDFKEEVCDLDEAWTSKYNDCGTPLGSGAFGFVVSVQEKGTEESVAIKYQLKSKWAENEIEMMKLFSGAPDIIDLIDEGTHVATGIELHIGLGGGRYNTFPPKPYLVIAMEQATQTLRRCSSASAQAKLKHFAAVLRGLEAMHEKEVAHRDLNWGNVLVFGHCADGKAQIADLALACKTTWQKMQCRGEKGTLQYFAPELVTSTMHSASRTHDMWAAGLMLHQLVFGELPGRLAEYEVSYRAPQFVKNAIKEMKEYEVKDLPEEWNQIGAGNSINELLSGLLQPNPGNRLKAPGAVELIAPLL